MKSLELVLVMLLDTNSNGVLLASKCFKGFVFRKLFR